MRITISTSSKTTAQGVGEMIIMDERDDIPDEAVEEFWKSVEKSAGVTILRSPVMIDEAWQPIIDSHIKQITMVSK